MEVTWSDWRKVPKTKRDMLWAELLKVFQYRVGIDEEKAKSYALKQIGQAYRRWRTYLNNKYAENNLTPFEEYGKIMQAQWDVFVR